MKKEKIDFVYAWVDGAFPGHLEERQRYASTTIDMNPERYRDTFQILKYSLRSVEKYASWHGDIILLTNKPQVPDWIDTGHPKVRIVHLEEFIPDQYLPTFSSNVIESFVHKVPNLSEHFVYMNDDFLFFKETPVQTFWDQGKYAIFNTLYGENLQWRVYHTKNNFIGMATYEHGPHFAKKEYWEAMANYRPEEMEYTRNNKFRDPKNLVTYKLYRSYMLAEKRELSIPVKKKELKKMNYFHKITNNLKRQYKGIKNIERIKPNFYCMNDDQRKKPNPLVIEEIRRFLDQYYPEPSQFEK